jgi:two-component system sensor histidine kinase AtoS
MRQTREMRADSMMFEDVFEVDATSGRISLGIDRHVLFDADAIGNMRRELIDNLGWDVSRGILERVGFQSGRDDARQLRSSYPWPSDLEWLRAGPRLHFLEGIVNVRVRQMEISRADHKFYMAGDWLDSYEAEQHLKHYGAGSRSVCWTLEGYATGYATEFFGEEIVCFETCCRGKGDPVCSFELRPAREWGNVARPIQEMLAAVRFTERFDRCLRSISQVGCELERTSLDAIITTDAHGNITSISDGGSELLGISRRDVVGKPAAGFYVAGTAEAGRIMKRLRNEGRIRNYLTDIVTPSGQRKPIVLAASAIKNSLGKIVGTIGVAHDLTDIRRLEDELAEKHQFMANILQDSADAIITLDPDNTITSWNRGAEAIFGYSAAEATGRSINLILPPELQEANELAVIAEKLRTHGAVRSFQTERLTKDGRRIQVIFTRTAIRDESGDLIGSSAVLKDVTTFRNLERQLADTEHLATLGELSAGLAHEIKNPLAGIKGAIDVIRDSLPATDLHREILGDVLHEVNRIDKIVRDLLNYAKPKPPSISEIHLAEIAQRLIAMARQSSKKEAQSIRLLQSGEIPGFSGDETQLEQVLLNLLLNAQAALPFDGHITVRLGYEPEEHMIRMEVEDDGPGIPEEIKKRIFQPFFTTRTDGTGLGLATCLKNVQYHGGTIDVWSEPGHGTRFIVNLPLTCRI